MEQPPKIHSERAGLKIALFFFSHSLGTGFFLGGERKSDCLVIEVVDERDTFVLLFLLFFSSLSSSFSFRGGRRREGLLRGLGGGFEDSVLFISFLFFGP